MPNKTIYVADDDLPLLQRAQELTGSTLSAAIVTALRRLVEVEEAKQSGFEEITVKVGIGRAGVKRFLGTALREWTSSTGDGTRAIA
jgi:hypothetical protein